MERIGWTEHRTNEEGLKKVEKKDLEPSPLLSPLPAANFGAFMH